MPDNSEEEVILNVNIVVNGQDQLAEVGAQMDDVAQQVGDAAKVVEDQLASIDQSMGEFDSGLNELVAQLDENAAQIAEEFAIIGAFVREAFQQINSSVLAGTSNEVLQQYLEELRGLGDVGEYVAGVIDNLAVAAGTEYRAFEIVNDNIREVEAAFAGEGVAAENLINRLIQLDLQQQLVSASSGGETQGFIDVNNASLKAALALVDQANALGQMLPLLDESGNVITKAADANAALANAAGGAVPPLNNLNVALGSGGESFNQYAAGLEFMAKALNNTQASLQNTIDKQVEDISRSLAMTRAIYEVAAASNTQKGALKSLEATADSLAGRLRIAEQAQDALRATFSASRSSLDMYGLALVTIGEAYAKLNTDIAEDVIAQIQQTRAALAAEQALLAYAQASGQSAAGVSILEQNVASLMEKLAFQREQLQVASDAWQLYSDDTQITEQALIRLTEGLGTNSNVLLRQIQDELRANEAQRSFITSLQQVADNLGITGDAYDALSYKIQTLTDNHFELERAQLLLQNTIERSNATYHNEGIALLDLSDRFTALDGDVRKNVDAQLEQVTTAQDATQRLLDYASANKFTAQVVGQLTTQYEALSAKADQLRGQQRMLNEVFGEEAPQMLRAYDEGLQYLAEQLNNASLKTTEEMQAELESVQARIQAAEALWRQADAAGASQSALNSLQDTIDSLTDKEHILAAAIKQVNDAAIQTPSEPTAPPGESPGGSEGMAQQNAFMMMMFAQRVMQLTQQFIALGAAADTSLAGIQAEMGLTQQATDGLATQLQGMAVSTGYGLNTLADGLKTIMEAGFNASEGLQVLQASAELARATSTNLATTTATLSSVMDTFHLDGTKAALTANQLMVGAQAAHQTVQAFATSLSQVAEDAVAAHVSFAEVASAEAVLSVRFGNASTAASTLSTLLHAVSLDANTVYANVQKAGLAFDAAKFQTLDWAGKLEYLSTITQGNGEPMLRLIGGADLLQQAMNRVGLSTQQLAANAVALGLSFNAAHYNSLSLIDKLQYLLYVSGGNAKTFQALMGGAANLNGAFQGLQLSTADVAARAQQLGLTFDVGSFKTDTLVQKLRALWDISGHNVGVFQSLVGGAKQADAALALIGGDGGAKYNQTMTAMEGNTRKLDTAFSTAMGSMGAKMGQLTAMIQNMSYQFLEAIKPQLTAFLTQLSGWVAILGQHMNIVMPIVAGLAIALGVVLIAALAPLIGMLAGIIAGAAPFIVIGAAIGAAAVLIYQNWSRVAPVLAPLIPIFNNVAHAITGFVQLVIANLPRIEAIVVQVFHQIVGFLVSTFFPVWQQLQNSFVDIRNAIIPLMPMIMQLGQALLIGIGIAVVLVIAITAGLIRMFAGLLVAVMQVVTGIIQFFSGFIQTMSGLLQFFVDLFSGKWQNLTRDLNNVMMGIVEMFLGAWNMVKGIFTAVFAVIVGFAQGFSSAIVAIFTDLQSILVGHSIIPDMANSIMQWFARLFSTVIAGVTGWVGNVVSWFGNLGSQAIQTVTSMVASLLALLGNLWTQGVARVQSLASGIMSILSSLPGQAMTWGADMISSFIGGIQSMAGSLMGAIGNIAGSVAHMLGFSKPDMGPLARSDEWMPDFGDLLEKGLLSNVPKLRNASQQVALALSHGIATPQGIAPTLTATAGNNPTVSFLAQILATLQQQGRSQTGAPLTSNSLTQQIGSVNFHGIRDLQSAYAQFNAYSGLAQEYANRGATAGLPL